jgi:DNA-binding MarR family transcriptional regulator
MSRSGADLALLLLGGFRALVDETTAELVARGHDDFKPLHEFSLRAIIAGADSASDLGRRTAVSKQAAAKTIAVLVERGYVVSETDPADARRKKLRVTTRGMDVMTDGEAILDALRESWKARIGAGALAELEAHLAELVGDGAIRIDAPGWVPTTRAEPRDADRPGRSVTR